MDSTSNGRHAYNKGNSEDFSTERGEVHTFECYTASPTDISPTSVVDIHFKDSDSQDVETSEANIDSAAMRLLKEHWMIFIGFFLSYSSMGIGLSVIGPTLIQLGRQINEESTSKLSMSYIGRAGGFFIGSFVGGQILDRTGVYGSQWALIFAVFTTGLTVALFPFVQNLFQFIALSTISAITMGMVDNFVQILVIRICADDVGPFLQALHSGFAIGAFISPSIASIFIEDDEKSTSYQSTFYVLGLFITLIVMYIVFLIFIGRGPVDAVERQAVNKSKDNARDLGKNSIDNDADLPELDASRAQAFDFDKHSMSPHTTLDEDHKIGHAQTTFDSSDDSAVTTTDLLNDRKFYGSVPILLGCTATMLFFYVGTETAIGSFLATYAFKLDLMTESEAAGLTSAYWGCFAFGRVLGIPMSMIFTESQLISTDLFFSLLALILIALWPSSVPMLWFATCLLGLAVASLYAATVSYLEKSIVITGQMFSVIVGIVAASEAVFPLIVGLAFELPAGPLSMMYISIAAVVFCAIMFVSLYSYRVYHSVQRGFNPVLDGGYDESIKNLESIELDGSRISRNI